MKMQLGFATNGIGFSVAHLIARVTGNPFHVACFFDEECIEAVAGGVAPWR